MLIKELIIFFDWIQRTSNHYYLSIRIRRRPWIIKFYYWRIWMPFATTASRWMIPCRHCQYGVLNNFKGIWRGCRQPAGTNLMHWGVWWDYIYKACPLKKKAGEK